MSRTKLIALGVGVGLAIAGVVSFRYDKYTGWVDEQKDPFNIAAVCKTTTSIEVFGQFWIKEGPVLPKSDCQNSDNYWLTLSPKEGCAVDLEALTAKCETAYAHPFF